MRSWRAANHSSSTSAKIMNDWRCTFTPPIFPQGVRRDSFTFCMKLVVYQVLAADN
jgi:hypothetical protein